jgi:hypothetical protein
MIRLLLPLVLTMGCAVKRTPAWEKPGLPFGTVSQEILDRMVQSGDRAFAARDKPEQIDDAMESWNGALRYRPHDHTILTRLSRAARLRAATLSANDALKHAEDAVAFAERAIVARNPAIFERVFDRARTPANIFAPAEKPDLPALIAYAEALFQWSELHGTATLLAQRDWIMGAATRAVQLDRTVENGAADRVLGMMYATLTLDLGGDYRLAEEHFERALAEGPAYLPTRLEYAARYCARMRDGARYRRLLKEVVDGNADVVPDLAPENHAAQKKAKELLAEAKSW